MLVLIQSKWFLWEEISTKSLACVGNMRYVGGMVGHCSIWCGMRTIAWQCGWHGKTGSTGTSRARQGHFLPTGEEVTNCKISASLWPKERMMTICNKVTKYQSNKVTIKVIHYKISADLWSKAIDDNVQTIQKCLYCCGIHRKWSKVHADVYQGLHVLFFNLPMAKRWPNNQKDNFNHLFQKITLIKGMELGLYTSPETVLFLLKFPHFRFN